LPSLFLLAELAWLSPVQEIRIALGSIVEEERIYTLFSFFTNKVTYYVSVDGFAQLGRSRFTKTGCQILAKTAGGEIGCQQPFVFGALRLRKQKEEGPKFQLQTNAIS
jgi:hypothetical protein